MSFCLYFTGNLYEYFTSDDFKLKRKRKKTRSTKTKSPLEDGLKTALLKTQHQLFEESENSEHSDSELHVKKISKLTNDDGKKKRQPKVHYCLFCGLPHKKIWRHWERCKTHIKPDFDEIKNLDRKSELFKTKQANLVNAGDFRHNDEVKIKGKGGITTKRRPYKDEPLDPNEYLPCPQCKGMIKKSNLGNHVRRGKCQPQKSKKKRRVNAAQLSDCRVRLAREEISENLSEVLSHLKYDDNITKVIMGDSYLLQFGEDEVSAERKDELGRYGKSVRDRLRLGAIFLINLRQEMRQEKGTLKSLLRPENWKAITRAVLKVQSPDNRLKIGHLIHKVADWFKSEAIINSDPEQKDVGQSIIDLYQSRWSKDISKRALREKARAKLNKRYLLPTDADIRKMTSGLKNYMEELTEEFKGDLNPETAKSLMGAIIVYEIIFNRRRPGNCLLFSTYISRPSHANNQFYKTQFLFIYFLRTFTR